MPKPITQSELLKEWQKARPTYQPFALDGILSPKHYEKSNPKILFLLKESNGDFVEIAPIKAGSNGYGPSGNSNTFWRYMRGYEKVINLAWRKEKYDDNAVKKAKEFPNINTAYLNLKKHCENKSSSNKDDIKRYVERDRLFLIKQIELIEPDLIYCAGTLDFFKILYPDLRKVEDRVFKSNGILVVDYYHLAHRKGYKTFEELHRILETAFKAMK